MGLSHESVIRAARKLGLRVQAQVDAGYGLPVVDLALQRDDGRKVAVQVKSHHGVVDFLNPSLSLVFSESESLSLDAQLKQQGFKRRISREVWKTR